LGGGHQLQSMEITMQLKMELGYVHAILLPHYLKFVQSFWFIQLLPHQLLDTSVM
jgi:hypothetical protein